MAPLDHLVDELFARPADEGVSLALVVQRGGELVAERYGEQPANAFEPARRIDADSRLISWSMAKSITHAAVGVLVADGRVDPQSPAAVPEWTGTEKQAITLLDLLEMRSGLHFVEDYVDGTTSNCLEMLFGESEPCRVRRPSTTRPPARDVVELLVRHDEHHRPHHRRRGHRRSGR